MVAAAVAAKELSWPIADLHLTPSGVQMVNFDWHGALKDLKEEGTVEALWSVLAAILPQVSLLLSPGVCGVPNLAAASNGSFCIAGP